MEKESLEGQRGRTGKSRVLDPKAREVGAVHTIECSARVSSVRTEEDPSVLAAWGAFGDLSESSVCEE